MKKQIFMMCTLFTLLSTTILSQDIFNAVKNNDLNKVKEIVENNLSTINSRDGDERTPLHWTARGVNYEIMKYLIDKGADVNVRDINNITPLTSVVARNHLDAAKLLIDNGAMLQEKDNLERAPIFYAIGCESDKMLELLIKSGAYLDPTNDYLRTPLLMTCRETGCFEIVKLLVDNGANINAKDKYGDTPLALAAWRGFEEIVNYLLDKNAEFSVDEDGGIRLLNSATDKRLWKLYLEFKNKAGDSFSKILKKHPVLQWAAAGGSKEIVEDLLKSKVDINIADTFGWSPLHYAAYFGRIDVADLLINNGADINSETPLGETPLYLARAESKKEIINLLISAGADQNIPTVTEISGKYFGQKLTSATLKLFAPGIVSRLQGGHTNVIFSNDGTEAVWTEWYLNDVGYSSGCKIWHSEMKNGYWQMPKIIVEKGDTPFYSTDESRLYYLTTRPIPPSGDSTRGIWYFEKSDSTFKNPQYLNFDVVGNNLYWQFSFDKDNNIYFGGRNGLSRSLFVNGEYQPRESLLEIANNDIQAGGPFIAPDGSYIIFSSSDLPGSFGNMDLYICYRNTNGLWSEPINMGPKVNSPEQEMLPIVSRDGKYLFVRASRNNVRGIYWIDASIIQELRSKIKS